MNNTKDKIHYIGILAVILLLTTVVFFAVASFCGAINAKIDAGYYAKSLEKDSKIVYPSTSGSGMGLDYVYNILDKYKKADADETHSWFVIYGASTSIVGMEDDAFGDDIIKACGGSATISSYYVMKNFMENEGLKYNQDMTVKIDISPVLFKKTNLSNDVLVSALEYAGINKVSEDFNVRSTFANGAKKFFGLNARKIGKSFEYLKEYADKKTLDGLFTPAVNNYSKYDKLISIDDEKIKMIEDFILSFDCPVMVDILYESTDLASSKAGIKFNEYVDTELIPFLEENDINYIDTRKSIPDEMFIDNTHLNSEGRAEYTKQVVLKMTESWR